jgi:hypothetical protein
VAVGGDQGGIVVGEAVGAAGVQPPSPLRGIGTHPIGDDGWPAASSERRAQIGGSQAGKDRGGGDEVDGVGTAAVEGDLRRRGLDHSIAPRGEAPSNGPSGGIVGVDHQDGDPVGSHPREGHPPTMPAGTVHQVTITSRDGRARRGPHVGRPGREPHREGGTTTGARIQLDVAALRSGVLSSDCESQS